MARVRHQADPLEPVGVALEAVAEVGMGFKRGAADLHQRRPLDAVSLHQSQELLGALLPVGGHGVAHLARELTRRLGEDVDVGIDHEARLMAILSSARARRYSRRSRIFPLKVSMAPAPIRRGWSVERSKAEASEAAEVATRPSST